MIELELYIPEIEDLWFYQKMLSDPATMSYNAPWGGCIDFPVSEWDEWHSHWVGREPERFYAYIRRKSDGAWIGDVNFHYNKSEDRYDMGIVIYAPYRGNGYSLPALRLLLDHAFLICGIEKIYNDFEDTRSAAMHIHLKTGFRSIGCKNGICSLLLTKEDYINERK